MANVALREAARTFFDRTRIWREWLDPLTVQAGVREYDLDLPVGAMVVRIERATVGGNPLPVLSPHALARDPAQGEQMEPGLSSRDRVLFTLTRALSEGAVVSVEASLKPNKSALGLPDELYEQHCEDIVEGAKQRLMLTRNADFYAPDLAMVAKDAFESAIATKTVTAWKGATGNTPRARVRWV